MLSSKMVKHGKYVRPKFPSFSLLSHFLSNQTEPNSNQRNHKKLTAIASAILIVALVSSRIFWILDPSLPITFPICLEGTTIRNNTSWFLARRFGDRWSSATSPVAEAMTPPSSSRGRFIEVGSDGAGASDCGMGVLGTSPSCAIEVRELRKRRNAKAVLCMAYEKLQFARVFFRVIDITVLPFVFFRTPFPTRFWFNFSLKEDRFCT